MLISYNLRRYNAVKSNRFSFENYIFNTVIIIENIRKFRVTNTLL